MARSRPLFQPVAWLSRGFILIGGIAVLRLLSLVPQPASGPDAERDRTEALGRGKPGEKPSAAALREGHETQDVDARMMGFIIMGLGGSVAVVIGLMILLLHGLEARRSTEQPAYTAQQTTPVAPPEPHLQTRPVEELDHYLAAEDSRLSSYAWTDAAHDRARIPIARAMTLTIGHGLEPAP